ncbi:hypothetical protein DHEL01_v203330 [Diaporthe helianthi]|uniref:HET domain-containing protein n=1 Tax=Diaporthe helianthi TaxID=158607 RepID=A0A2P5I6Y5_DIAHE|nr:hypothetical protein DHEL01_v203330 [Diaporthe helianthi]
MSRPFDHSSFGEDSSDPRAYYRKISVDWIEHTQTLDILAFANLYSDDDEPEEKFPSWVINWDLPTAPIWARALPCRFEIIHYDEPCPTRLRRWLDYLYVDCLGDRRDCIDRYQGATPGTEPSWSFRDWGRSLSVSGTILTQITSHFRPEQGLKEYFSFMYDECLVREPQFKKGCASSRAFLSRAKGAPNDPIFLAWLGRRLRAIRRYFLSPMGKFRLALKLCRTPFEGCEKEACLELAASDKEFCADVDTTCQLLREERLSLVCCEDNDLCPGGVGFAARGARTGDMVVLVPGVSYPLVLRPTDGDRFRLVGPLFLPGVMDGELKEELKPGMFREMVLV